MTTSTPKTDGPIDRSSADHASQRDLQRSTLSELVALVKQSAARQQQIADTASEAVAQEETQHLKLTRQIEDRVNQVRESAQQKHGERLDHLNREFRQRSTALDTLSATSRQQQQQAYNQARAHVKQEMNQARWLAESVYDGTQAQLRVEEKETAEQIDAHLEAVDAMQREGIAMLHRYGHRYPDAAQATLNFDRLLPKQSQALLEETRNKSEAALKTLKQLPIPQLFVGFWPWLLLILVAAATGGITLLVTGTREPDIAKIAINTGIALAVAVVLGIAIKMLSGKKVRLAAAGFAQAVTDAQQAGEAHARIAAEDRDSRAAHAARSRDRELESARKRFDPMLAKAEAQMTTARSQADTQHQAQSASATARYDQEKQSIDDTLQQQLDELNQRRATELQKIETRHAERLQEIESHRAQQRQTLEKDWAAGLHAIQRSGDRFAGAATGNWSSQWQAPSAFPAVVPFGSLRIDLQQLIGQLETGGTFSLPLPDGFAMPAYLAFPSQASLFIETDRTGRDRAIATLQMVMARLLVNMPPGRARFTLIDPVSLGQNFAGFMHLADFDDGLVGGRIWTDSEQIQKRLADLTEHMETVIQKYLRNEFATIDDYNAQAGELAEPYQFLVIADLPVNFDAESMRRLASIATSGARCGVYTLIHRDLRHAVPDGSHLDEIRARSITLTQRDGRFGWDDDVFGQFPLTLDAPPDEATLTQMLQAVGNAARDATRVEVPFGTIAPPADQFWTRDSSKELAVPVGRMGATRLQEVRLGRGVAQHVLIAGKTGSGKSTLLHALVTNIAMWYSPDQVELYLIDFKKGVEFKTYATHELPHARAIAVESDREFGLSVLHRLDAEMARRGELYRAAGVQDLAGYRQARPTEAMPRVLLVIDEYQEFFTEDDKLSQDAALLIDRLVRQGRAFGMHVLLGSQTIGGAAGLSRSTLGQMAVRVALQCSEADSQLILGDANNAARLLSRPGEAIYNDAGGLVEGNSPFQVAWLPDEHRDGFLQRVNQKLEQSGYKRTSRPVVFEGNAAALLERNSAFMQQLDRPWQRAGNAPAAAYLGDPVAIKDPTAIRFRRQSGANALVVGQQEESALAMACAVVLSLAAQQSPAEARFVVLDGTAADSPLAGTFDSIASAIPHEVQVVPWRGVEEAVNRLATELTDRQQTDEPRASLYVIVHGLQRYRMLRKREESFSFSLTDDEAKSADTGKQFADLLRDGPPAGIHVLTWADTSATLERTLDRSLLREFDHRILFQMSANDSSNLIDSPAANKLGFYRAVAFSEEQGTLEKFRPYALVSADLLQRVQDRLQQAASH